jgi:opacity protein-like surface antigen
MKPQIPKQQKEEKALFSRKALMLLTAVLFLATASISYAGTASGMLELGVQGSYSKMEEDVQVFAAAINFGYFFTPQLQMSLSGILCGGGEGSDVTKIYAGLGQFKYNLSFNRAQVVVPYLGVQAGIAGTSNGTSKSGFSYGGMAGLRFFISENMSLNMEGNYQWAKASASNNDVGVFYGFLGFSFYK